ncbi:MAG TPA: SAM-dependent methyltransferase, partial [Candidatus Cybelea sp.]
ARAHGITVEVLPGGSAATGVAVLSGFSLRRFTFEGFPPRTSAARRERFKRSLQPDATTIWYESPQRIRAVLADLAAVAPDARLFLVREYTKLHEEQLTGTPQDVLARLTDPVRGEVAFAVGPYEALAGVPAREATSDAIDELLEDGHRVGEVAKLLAARGFGDRQQLYARAAARKARRKTSIKKR